jgi:hypothetical protein
MKKIQWVLGVVLSVFLVFLFCGCGTSAHVQRDNTVDFSKLKTYAWVEGTQKDSLSKKPNKNDLVDRKIKQSITKNMQQNGWREVSVNPDVWLVYDVDIQRENRRVSDPVYSYPTTRWFYNPYSRRFIPVYYPSQFMGYREGHESVREGTLTLTMLDAGNNKTIWQGWISSDINGRHMSDREINENVKAIVKKLG